VAVELLDSYVCMRHSNQPERLMALKIRLSRQLGYRVIQVIITCYFKTVAKITQTSCIDFPHRLEIVGCSTDQSEAARN